MHSSRELRSSSFELRVDGRPARLEDLLAGFGEQDRLGVVMSRPCGAVGASALITATITGFYDFHRARGPEFFAYPDYYLFHVGRPLGDHARLDVWPRRKEVVVEDEPQAILEAIDDRAITSGRSRGQWGRARSGRARAGLGSGRFSAWPDCRHRAAAWRGRS
jgi:hypothetical protein